MSRLRIFLTLPVIAATSCGPGHVESQVIPPGRILNFEVLYAKNCAGCHGQEGKGGAAIGLSDSVFLAIVNDATLSRVTSNGVPGTSMPAFAQHSGGMLSDEQIKVIVSGMRTHWAKPDVLRDAPPYAAQSPGDPKRGEAVYGVYCSSCHGADGRGTARGSAIVDGSYLALVSDQYLRTTVIVGRPELGAPNWGGNVAGKPMSAEEISDVVAWLAAQRATKETTPLRDGAGPASPAVAVNDGKN
jgi:mono/diheme cytochrome c family protein